MRDAVTPPYAEDWWVGSGYWNRSSLGCGNDSHAVHACDRRK